MRAGLLSSGDRDPTEPSLPVSSGVAYPVWSTPTSLLPIPVPRFPIPRAFVTPHRVRQS